MTDNNALAQELFEHIKHGDAAHQEWLRKELQGWFALRQPAPASGEVGELVDALRTTRGDLFDARSLCNEAADMLERLAGSGEKPRFPITKEWSAKMAELEGDAEIGAGMPDHPLRQPVQEAGVDQVDRVARAIANANGDEFANAFNSKARWTAKRGMSGGRFRDVNEPFQSDYLDMARAAIAAMQG